MDAVSASIVSGGRAVVLAQTMAIMIATKAKLPNTENGSCQNMHSLHPFATYAVVHLLGVVHCTVSTVL